MRRPASLTGHTVRFTVPRVTTSKSADRLNHQLRSKRLSMKIATRRRAKMELVGPIRRVAVADEGAVTGPINRNRNLPGAGKRKKKMMRVKRKMTMNPTSMNYRRQPKPCAMMGVRPCTPLIGSSSTWAREVNVTEPTQDSRRPLKMSRAPIIFDKEDHPDHTTAVGCLSLLVSPMI